MTRLARIMDMRLVEIPGAVLRWFAASWTRCAWLAVFDMVLLVLAVKA